VAVAGTVNLTDCRLAGFVRRRFSEIFLGKFALTGNKKLRNMRARPFCDSPLSSFVVVPQLAAALPGVLRVVA
jgi:hypothetical protein